MSGTPSLPSGDRTRHIRAARDWLRRAEEQFSAGESVLASATLMLAQAELKLIVESVAAGAIETDTTPRPSGFRLARSARLAMGVAAMAACLLLGIYMGRAWAPQPDGAGVDTPAVIQIAEKPEVSSEPPADAPEFPGPEQTVEEIVGPSIEELQEPDDAQVIVAETEPVTPPPSPRRTVYAPRPAPAPEEMEPVEVAAPQPVESPPVETTEIPEWPKPPRAEPDSDPEEIHPAEVTLRTIQALSDRLLNGKDKE